MLDQEGSSPKTEPIFDVETVQRYFQEAYSSQEKQFFSPSWLPDVPHPGHPFDEGPLTVEELKKVIKRARVSSSPSSLDQLTYLVIRRCPSLHPTLLDVHNQCWEQHIVLRSWKEGVIRLIPKPAAKDAPLFPGNFRPIALTSCVGRFSHLSSKISDCSTW